MDDDVLAGLQRFGFAGIVRRRHGVVRARLVNLHRLAVEVRVGEMAGGAAEIHEGEVEFVRVLVHPSAAPDDLLELGHGTDLAVEHDEPAGLDVNPGGQQPRGRNQNGIGRFPGR